MVELQEIFSFNNGLSSSNVTIHVTKENDSIPYTRPASTIRKTIAGYVYRKHINSRFIFPRNTLFVSTDGEGSHTYSYLSTSDFVPNSNVVALVPKIELTTQQKLYYSFCITRNRYLFSYGRKPKGDRLKKIKVPSINELPDWVNDVDLSRFDGAEKSKIQKNIIAPSIDKTTKLKDLFEVKNGIAATGLNIKENRFSGCIAYIRPASTNARIIRGFLDRSVMDEKHIYPKGSLFVSTNGEGSHSYSYVAIEDFVPNSDVSVLIPKNNMSLELKLYYAKCIVANRYLFSYGRKPKGKRLAGLLLPKPTSVETKEIEEFMKSLNYSINL